MVNEQLLWEDWVQIPKKAPKILGHGAILLPNVHIVHWSEIILHGWHSGANKVEKELRFSYSTTPGWILKSVHMYFVTFHWASQPSFRLDFEIFLRDTSSEKGLCISGPRLRMMFLTNLQMISTYNISYMCFLLISKWSLCSALCTVALRS